MHDYQAFCKLLESGEVEFKMGIGQEKLLILRGYNDQWLPAVTAHRISSKG